MTATKSPNHGVMTTGKYATAYVALLFLSALTFGLSFAPLKSGEWFVALGIAAVKSLIVAWFFMHLVEMPTVHRLAAVLAVSLLAVLILFAVADVRTRADSAEENLATIGPRNAPATSVADRLPSTLNNVGVDERLSAPLPKQLAFFDENGHAVQLGELFDGKTPVVLTLNYSNCPMLCSLELSGLTRTLKQLDLEIGKSYRLVTVSLDPDEKPETAHRTQSRYLEQLGKPGATASWRFLTGTESNIRALADAIGFRYRYDPIQRQYSHPAVIAISSPHGQLMRYLYGIEFDARTLKLALVEASEGRVGSTADKLILFCSVYDPRQGSYAWIASRAVRVAGAFVLVGLGSLLFILWRRDAKRLRTPTLQSSRRGNAELQLRRP